MKGLAWKHVGVSALILLGACAAFADNTALQPKPGSAELERVKTWVGRWEGKSNGHGEEQSAAAEYKLTSGGSAVIETLFPGTPHEMVSVYYDKDGKLAMTHYCMLGNRPEFSLTGAGPQRMDFSLDQSSPIPAGEMHMHALSIALAEDGGMTQSWTLFENGQAKDTTNISLKRVTN